MQSVFFNKRYLKISTSTNLNLSHLVAKRPQGKSKEEAQLEKEQELKRRLADVRGQLGGGQSKKTPKKGLCCIFKCKWVITVHLHD